MKKEKKDIFPYEIVSTQLVQNIFKQFVCHIEMAIQTIIDLVHMQQLRQFYGFK